MSESEELNKLLDKACEYYPQANNIVSVLRKEGKLKKLNEESCREIIQLLIEQMLEDINDSKDFGKSNALLRLLIDVKRAFWPATQKSITANVDIFDEQLRMWFEARKKLEAGEITQNIEFIPQTLSSDKSNNPIISINDR